MVNAGGTEDGHWEEWYSTGDRVGTPGIPMDISLLSPVIPTVSSQACGLDSHLLLQAARLERKIAKPRPHETCLRDAAHRIRSLEKYEYSRERSRGCVGAGDTRLSRLVSRSRSSLVNSLVGLD